VKDQHWIIGWKMVRDLISMVCLALFFTVVLLTFALSKADPEYYSASVSALNIGFYTNRFFYDGFRLAFIAGLSLWVVKWIWLIITGDLKHSYGSTIAGATRMKKPL